MLVHGGWRLEGKRKKCLYTPTFHFYNSSLELNDTCKHTIIIFIHRGGADNSKLVRPLQIKDHSCMCVCVCVWGGGGGVYNRQCATVKTTCGIKMQLYKKGPLHNVLLSKQLFWKRERQGLVGSLHNRPTLRLD